MLRMFEEVEKKRMELDWLRVIIQADEITYRQKGEEKTAASLEMLRNKLEQAIKILAVR